jgi:hypothetical protein
MDDRAGRQCVVADNAVLADRRDDVDDGGPCRLCRPRDAAQPVGLGFGAAVEGGDVVAPGVIPARPIEVHGPTG